MKNLVAYFSASGNTQRLSKKLADVIGADIFEIEPAVPYSNADLDWTNEKSRSSLEMKDVSSRPQIANKLENINDYNIIFVGFPIWWYIAPTIINTFLEQYDLTGKTIIPFATSGSSDMGDTNMFLKNSCKGATLLEGKRFSANASEKELEFWIKNL